jgi:anti-sigma B factor antagonist
VDIKVRKTGTTAILDLKGPLKMGEAEQAFKEQVSQLVESGTRNLAINLADVPELDSAGIGALVRAYTSVKNAGGTCRFFGASKRIKGILRMVRLDSVLEVVENEAAALGSTDPRR